MMDPAVQTLVQTKGLALQKMPPLSGKSAASIRTLLGGAGFKQLATGTQEVWGHADGSIIRMAMTGTNYRPYPHLKKEISWTPMLYGFDDIACKVTESGVPVPKDPNGQRGAGTYLSQWFSSKVARNPGIGDGSELEQLLKVWGNAVPRHKPLPPPDNLIPKLAP
jgi:hypothetical protein